MARFKTGQVTVSAVAQQVSSADGEYSAYILKAKASNAATVSLGDSTVATGTGFLLEPGESFAYGVQVESGEPVFDVRLQDLYVIGTPGDTVSWLAHKV
jgi:hypothetical protein